MSKTIKNSYDSKLTFDSICRAYERSSKGKRNKKEVLIFNIDLETNLIRIYDDLRKGLYRTGKYNSFTIWEPKERVIKSLPFRDRIVQQWYIEEFIKPYFLPRFSKDTYACLDKRGTHSAVKTTQSYMQKMQRKYGSYYVLKGDIKKYFYSIDKSILFTILASNIGDNKLLALTHDLIFDTPDNIGIPIGNYTSQFFANIYLNELDKYVKEELNIKYYIRYMDDFVLLLKSQEESKAIYKKIEFFLNSKLKLSLNNKSRYYPNRLGINFCGYIIYETHILLRKRSKIKIRKNIKVWAELKKANLLNYQKMQLSYNSWLGHAKHANSFSFIKKVQLELSNCL